MHKLYMLSELVLIYIDMLEFCIEDRLFILQEVNYLLIIVINSYIMFNIKPYVFK